MHTEGDGGVIILKDDRLSYAVGPESWMVVTPTVVKEIREINAIPRSSQQPDVKEQAGSLKNARSSTSSLSSTLTIWPRQPEGGIENLPSPDEFENDDTDTQCYPGDNAVALCTLRRPSEFELQYEVKTINRAMTRANTNDLNVRGVTRPINTIPNAQPHRPIR